MEDKNTFHSPTKGQITLRDVIREISDFMSQEGKYELVVGTDSNGDKKADFVTAIIAYRVGKGGRYFWKKTNGGKIYHTLRDRIYQEVALSLSVAQDVLRQFGQSLSRDFSNYDFQIHIDVGQNGPTKEMVKEVVGIVRGIGLLQKFFRKRGLVRCFLIF